MQGHEGEFLMHYGRSKRDGAPIGSGRYPLGSGEEPYQRDGRVGSLDNYVNDLMKQGFTMKDIAKLNHMELKDLRNEVLLDKSNIVSERTGEQPYNKSKDGPIHTYYADARKRGLKEKEIAQLNQLTIDELRAKVSISSNQERALNVAKACQLRDHGYGPTEIGRKMGVSESTVRGWLKPKEDSKEGSLQYVADTLKKKIDDEGCYLEVGQGSELYLKGVSQTKMKTAVAMLKEQGYEKIVIQADQGITGRNQKTYLTVIAPPGTQYKDVVNNTKNIKTLESRFEKNEDGDLEIVKLKYPETVKSSRVMIRYAEEGGADKDGLIELRKGAKDLDLGPNSYAQVRINVDNTHYIKGMAMYCADDKVMPKGVDIIFNTSKKKGTPMMDDDPNAKQVLKLMKDPTDPVNPFGSYIRAQRGALNLCKEEGKWDEQQDRLAQQFLSKQPVETAKRQMELAYAIKRDELTAIENYTNPAVKKKLLQSFADSADAAAVELHGAALPRQSWKVILPLPQLKENEIYAPTYRQGEEVVLVRFPHGGIFELPVCKVNNRIPAGKKCIGQATDAIGINPKTAQQLSGADFDGDSVIVIPTNGVKIRTSSPLAALKDFDAKAEFPYTQGMKVMSKKNTGREMGKITNLITDMTVLGANTDELARAVKHSMVVIDAEKHKLNYKASEEANGIPELKAKFQKGGGAQTILSRAKNEKDVEGIRTELKYAPDKVTGEKRYKIKYEEYYNKKTGKMQQKITKSTQMAEANTKKEVYDLISFKKDKMEYVYADYAWNMKQMANEARKVMVNTKDTIHDKGAEKAYAEEVRSLNAKLIEARKNSPRERVALAYADQIVKEKKLANPDKKDDKEWVKKIRANAIQNARAEMQAKKKKINITPREWDAIQAGAFSNSKLTQILNNADEDQVKKYAMPKEQRGLTDSQIARIKAYANSSYTISDIADAMGISPSTVSKYIKS